MKAFGGYDTSFIAADIDANVKNIIYTSLIKEAVKNYFLTASLFVILNRIILLL
jgi:hypothetical protein